MTDLETCLWAVLADPDDSTVRLAFADACEEAGDVSRAEFIRTQLRLDTHPGCSRFMYSCGEFTDLWGLSEHGCPECQSYARLKLREMALLRGVGSSGKFNVCEWADWPVSGRMFTDGKGSPSSDGKAIEYVPFGLGGERLEATYCRGFIVCVRTDLATFQANAKQLFSGHPITAVHLPDVVPYYDSDLSSFTFRVSGLPYRHTIYKPYVLHQLLELSTTYSSAQQALNALSRACVRYGRQQASLPKWEGRP